MRIVCWNKVVMRSDGLPWNGWTIDLDDEGPWSFETGAWWQALLHLSQCKRCRRVNKVSKRKIERRLRSLEEEWRTFTA